jgi:hypothetical protein
VFLLVPQKGFNRSWNMHHCSNYIACSADIGDDAVENLAQFCIESQMRKSPQTSNSILVDIHLSV